MPKVVYFFQPTKTVTSSTLSMRMVVARAVQQETKTLTKKSIIKQTGKMNSLTGLMNR